MPKTNHPRRSQTDWESHKDTIRKLYLVEDRSLMGECGVIDLMKQKGFSASKPQYESQFMRWGFKKKLTREIWHTIGRIIKDREETGLASYVYANGMNLSEEKVNKETARYKNCDANGECCLRKELPAGVEVRSNQEQVEETVVSLEVQATHLSNSQTVKAPADLSISDEFWNLRPDSDSSQPHSPNKTNNRIPTDLLHSSMCGDVPYHTPFPGTLISIPSPLPTPSTQFEDDARFVLSITPGLEELLQTPFQGHCSPTLLPLSAPTSQLNNDTRFLFASARSSMETYFIPINTISLFTNLGSPLFREFRAFLKDSHSVTLASINQTKHLLPSESSRELQRYSVDVVILRQILYLLMNNFAGSDYAVFDTLFEQVKQFSVSHMEDMLDALPHPYAAALQQSILTIAIKSNIPALVSLLLRRDLDINRVACRFGGRDYTPLGLACKFHRAEVVKVLLRANADPNKPMHQYPDHSPMYLLLDLEKSTSQDKLDSSPMTSEILRYLLDAHARITPKVLEHTAFWESESILDVFIHHNKLPIDLSSRTTINACLSPVVEELCKSEKLTAVLQSMFQGHSLQVHGICIWNYLQAVLWKASYWGNLRLVDYCLEFGLTPDVECLCQAIYGDRLVLVKKYTEWGIDIHQLVLPRHRVKRPMSMFSSTVDPALSEGYSFVIQTTPFAEAIRYGHQEIVSYLKSYSSPQVAVSSEYVFALITAAAEVGNKDMVQELLMLDETKPLRVDTAPGFSVAECSVAAATLGCHDDIVELLMMAGVRPNEISIAAAILTRNVRLVELFLNSTTSIRSEISNTFLAVRWSDRDVLKLLIEAGFSSNEVGTGLHPLELPSLADDIASASPLTEAIRRGNYEIVQLLLENGTDVNGYSPGIHGLPKRQGMTRGRHSPLTQAVKRGDESLIRSLLDHGADPNDPDALRAATKKSYKLVKVILDSFCQRYPKGNKSFVVQALREAIKNRDESLVRVLVSHTDVNFKKYHISTTPPSARMYSRSLLGEGIATGSINIVQTLLNSGGNPNSTVEISDQGRLNAILKAISTGNLDMVKFLRTAGANLNFSATLRIARTALQLAVELGHFEIVEYLLSQGVDVNAPPYIWEGGTALQYAAMTGSVRIAEILLQGCVDINAPGSKYLGKTAFECAAEHGRIDMLLWLFHQGVDIVSDGGKQVRRAQELAEESGQIAAKDLVGQLGAEAYHRTFSALENNILPTGAEGWIENTYWQAA